MNAGTGETGAGRCKESRWRGEDLLDLTSLDRKCEDVLVLQFETRSGSLVSELQTGSSSSGSGVTILGGLGVYGVYGV